MSGILNILAAGKAAASTFLPSDLTNLIGWYKADTGVTTSSGNVTAVVNQASPGTGNLFNVGTVPFTATSAYNSLPAFGFTLANDAALTTGTTLNAGVIPLPIRDNLSIFLVGQMLTATGAFSPAVSIASTADPDYNSPLEIRAITREFGNGIGSFYNGSTHVGSAVSLATNVRIGAVFNASTVTYYVNGVAGTPVTLSLVPLAANSNIIIGNAWAPFSNANNISGAAWEGPILEVVVATTVFSSGDVASLDAYFVARLGA